MKIRIHYIDEDSQKLIYDKLSFYVPRVGDEIRFAENEFFKVKYIVWCYDEVGFYERVNILIDKIKKT